MHPLDWLIVLSYLAYVIWHGLKLSRGSLDSESFFLAGRSLPWWAVGLSVMATQMSAITLIGTTGQAYEDGMRFIQFYFGLPLAMIILCVTAVPFFYRAKVFTAYEYLEQRFDSRTRTLTSFFFLISRGLGVGVIIAAPAVVLSIVLGWGELITIFAIGLSTTFYTMMGGVQAVTWTDVKQMAIIIIGLAICVLVILQDLPEDVSLKDALFVAGAVGKLETIDFTFDLTERYTFWSGTIAALFLFLSYFGCDQSQVQRYLTARSEDESRTSLLMSAFLKIPLQFLILFIGILVFVFYQFAQPPMVFNELAQQQAADVNPAVHQQIQIEFTGVHEQRRLAALDFIDARNTDLEATARASYVDANAEFSASRREATEFVRQANDDASFNDVNYVFPTFVLQNMPLGVVGLIVAAILAAAMSSVAAELNSLATTSTMDLYRQHINPDSTEKELLRFGRIATLLWGLFACVVATFVTNLGSLIEVVNTFGSLFYGSLLGVFVLAFVVPSAKSAGAFYGLLFGMVSVWTASYFTDIAFLWFNVVGCLVTVAAGYLISAFSKEGV
ncbi:sodium:solute symporter [Gammaproteobacteria bacterium]|nr:sodium:solute symporter [Gammaproteobacteria bacterium]MDC3239217.1 sodium:solute symporter [Gammaproteobacteria bacterium]